MRSIELPCFYRLRNGNFIVFNTYFPNILRILDVRGILISGLACKSAKPTNSQSKTDHRQSQNGNMLAPRLGGGGFLRPSFFQSNIYR